MSEGTVAEAKGMFQRLMKQGELIMWDGGESQGYADMIDQGNFSR